jgi:hypothetical protein
MTIPLPSPRANTSRLTPLQVRELRARAAAGELLRVLAVDYGVSRGFVSMVVNRRRLTGAPYDQIVTGVCGGRVAVASGPKRWSFVCTAPAGHVGYHHDSTAHYSWTQATHLGATA